MYPTDIDTGSAFASVGFSGQLGSELVQLLMAQDIVPGSDPGYQLCKTIYSYHPLGAILAEAPVKRAQGQARILRCPVLGEDRIVRQFEQTWNALGKLGGTKIIRNLMTLSRVYGLASIAVGERGAATSSPLDLATVDAENLYFNILDPLNTAGSLVLNQDPNSPIFLKQGTTYVNGIEWHPSRTIAKMNEDPLYIQWSASAFGFVGRSCYQRALFPLKTFVQSMMTDQMVTQKCGLLVAKMEAPGSIINNVMQSMFGWKRGQIKAGVTNQVLSIGTTEDVASLNLQNLEAPARFARENAIKNIASAAGMPASIIAQETLTEGFGEGSEDAKKEASYLNDIREEMDPVYLFMDRVVMRIAWTPEFVQTLHADYPTYAELPYKTVVHSWMSTFSATWPNALIEPESDKSKAQDVQFKAVIALIETMAPLLDPENLSKLLLWAAENVNEREELFASKLDLDESILQAFLETKQSLAQESASAENEPNEPPAFSARA